MKKTVMIFGFSLALFFGHSYKANAMVFHTISWDFYQTKTGLLLIARGESTKVLSDRIKGQSPLKDDAGGSLACGVEIVKNQKGETLQIPICAQFFQIAERPLGSKEPINAHEYFIFPQVDDEVLLGFIGVGNASKLGEKLQANVSFRGAGTTHISWPSTYWPIGLKTALDDALRANSQLHGFIQVIKKGEEVRIVYHEYGHATF